LSLDDQNVGIVSNSLEANRLVFFCFHRSIVWVFGRRIRWDKRGILYNYWFLWQ